jgi:hypothetical protein
VGTGSIFKTSPASGFGAPEGLDQNEGALAGFTTNNSNGVVAAGSVTAIDGGQSLAYTAPENPSKDELVYQGVGQYSANNTTDVYSVAAQTNPSVGNGYASGDGAYWGNPAGALAFDSKKNAALYAADFPNAVGVGPLTSTANPVGVAPDAVDIASGTFSGGGGLLAVTVHNGGFIQTLIPQDLLSPTDPNYNATSAIWSGPGEIADATVVPGSVAIPLVPEPTSLGLVAFTGLALLGRRRSQAQKA